MINCPTDGIELSVFPARAEVDGANRIDGPAIVFVLKF